MTYSPVFHEPVVSSFVFTVAHHKYSMISVFGVATLYIIYTWKNNMVQTVTKVITFIYTLYS